MKTLVHLGTVSTDTTGTLPNKNVTSDSKVALIRKTNKLAMHQAVGCSTQQEAGFVEIILPCG
jgi:hypothetical protein